MKKTLGDLFYIIFGTFIVYFILYIRVFRDKLPKDLKVNLFETGHYFNLILYLILFLLFFYFSILLIRIKLHKRYHLVEMPQSSKFLDKFIIISNLWSKSLKELSTFIINLPFIKTHLYHWLRTFGKFCYTNFLTKKKWLIIVLLTNMLPKSIFLGAFIVDVMVFHKFEYVYKVSFLMLIPLIESSLLYFLSEFCEQNLEQMDEVITITGETSRQRIPAKTFFMHKFVEEYGDAFNLKNEIYPLKESNFIAEFTEEYEKYQNTEKGFDFINFINTFFQFTIPIAAFELFYKTYKNWILSYFHCVYFLIFTSIWLYMLVYCW